MSEVPLFTFSRPLTWVSDTHAGVSARRFLTPQPPTLNPQPSTLNPEPSTLNPHPSTAGFAQASERARRSLHGRRRGCKGAEGGEPKR